MTELNESNNLTQMNTLYRENNKNNTIFNSKYLFKHPSDDLNNPNNLADQIRNSSNEILTNIEVVKSYHSKIMTDVHMIRDVLTYEFLFYNPKQKISIIEELLATTIQELNKYQGIVGGYKIEDNEWLLLKESNHRFKLKPSQIGIYNTMDRNDCFDEGQTWFFKKFASHMRRFICNDTNNGITFDYKLYDDESNDIGWILFICENKMLNVDSVDLVNDDQITNMIEVEPA